MQKTELDPADIERIIQLHFDMKCDECDAILKSLPDAQYHYLHEHNNFIGYIKCCSIKLKDFDRINGHIHYHLNPDSFK